MIIDLIIMGIMILSLISVIIAVGIGLFDG